MIDLMKTKDWITSQIDCGFIELILISSMKPQIHDLNYLQRLEDRKAPMKLATPLVEEIRRPGTLSKSYAQFIPDEHPLLNPLKLVIKTPMMTVVVEHIQEMLFDFDSGGCLLGGFRIGKTIALQTITQELSESIDMPVYCHYFSADKLEKDTIKQMYEMFCYQENIPTKRNAKGLDLRECVIHRLLDRLILSGGQQIVLLIDELQRLNTDQLEALASLHDIFRRLGVNVCIIFVGNTDPSNKIIDAADKEDNRLIYGRFFENQKPIYGIRTKRELRKCLAEFDRLQYPEGGVSYTHYFLHDDAPKNWKLTSLTDIFWDVYRKDFWPKIKERHSSLGLKYFISTVRSLLIFFLSSIWTEDKAELREMIRQAMKRSRIGAERVRVA